MSNSTTSAVRSYRGVAVADLSAAFGILAMFRTGKAYGMWAGALFRVLGIAAKGEYFNNDLEGFVESLRGIVANWTTGHNYSNTWQEYVAARAKGCNAQNQTPIEKLREKALSIDVESVKLLIDAIATIRKSGKMQGEFPMTNPDGTDVAKTMNVQQIIDMTFYRPVTLSAIRKSAASNRKVRFAK